MHLLARRSQAFVFLGIVSAGACGTRTDRSNPAHDERVPIAQAYLDRAAPDNGGLLTEGPDGLPVTEGDRVDPAIIEARLYYDTVQSPNATSQAVDFAAASTSEQPA